MSPLTETHGDEEVVLVDSLSPRERQLLEMATAGLTDQAIANELGISLATVSTYWGRIRIKYGPLGRTEIVARFLRALMSRATAELTASEERMRTVLEALPLGVFLTDGAGKPIYVNSAYAKIAGRTNEELLEEGLASLVFPDDQRQAQEERERCLAEGKGYTAEHRWTRGDGTVVWVRLRSDAWLVNGMIAGRVGVVEDVTQEHEARQRQAEAEERYRLLFALAPEAIVSVDEGLKVVGFNASAERMFGYRLDEILGQTLATLIPERFREGHRAHIERFGQGTVAAARPMASRSEVRGLRSDGTDFPCEASIVRQILDGKPHYTAIIRDVSDRVRSTPPQSSLDAIPLIAWRVDERGETVDGNAALREFVGQTLGDPVDPLDRPAFEEALHRAAGNGGKADVRLRLRRSLGASSRWHLCRIEGDVVVATDVHELETAAEELRKVRALLGSN
ncbi:PAS domain S-box protein [bacterium]|nr:MAG: PAS domain S-box protein [bacterium]